jgi:Winged helix DNA-binding domain
MTMVTSASRRDVARLRLRAQALVGHDAHSAVDVVERMLALQAQDFLAAKWALGVRSPGLSAADVDAALNSGSIVRSWPMRGTLHVVPPTDLNWMLQLTTPRLLAGTKTRQAQLDLDQPVIEQARMVAHDVLSGGRELSRAGFLRALEDHGIATAAQRGYHLIWHLAQSGTLCWGRVEGTAQVLVLLDEWVPRPRRLHRDEALGEFLVRYLRGHGPATISDFAWWSQLTLADARTGLAVAGDRLSELEVDGQTLYLAAATDVGELGSRIRQRSPVLTLGNFDEYLLGYRDRSFSVDPANLVRVVPGKNGIFLPLMVSNGRVIGTWRRQTKGRSITAEPQPFGAFSDRAAAGFARSIERYAAFFDVTATVLAAAPQEEGLAALA